MSMSLNNLKDTLKRLQGVIPRSQNQYAGVILDFFDEMYGERTMKNPDFPKMVSRALRKMRDHERRRSSS